MAKAKIHEISKEINVSNSEIIEFLNSKGVQVKSHMNNIDDDEIRMVKEHFGKTSPAKKETKAKEEASEVKARPEKKDAAPVIKKENAPAKAEQPAKPAQAAQQPLQRPAAPGAVKRPEGQEMLRRPDQGRPQPGNGQQTLRRPAQPGQHSQINAGPAPRRMLDGPQERRSTINPQQGQPMRRPDGQGQRRMPDGPQGMRRPSNGMNRPQGGQNKNNGPRVINGVTISSDDGSRLIHGVHASEADIEAAKRAALKENAARRDAERAEAERRAQEKARLEEELVEKARKEKEQMQENIAGLNLGKNDNEESGKEKASETKPEVNVTPETEPEKEKKEQTETVSETPVRRPGGTPLSTDVAVNSDPNKKFKTIAGPVRPNIISRGNPTTARPAQSGNDRPGFRNTNDRRPSGNGGQGRPDNRQGGGYNNQRPSGDRNHYQEVGSRYDGNNRGHSNLFESQSQRNYGQSGQNGQGRDQRGSRPNNGFSQRPQGFGGGKDEDEQRPVSHSRDPRKRSSAGPEIAENIKNSNNRRADKSKDKAKADKRFGDFDEMQGRKGKNAKDPNRAGAFHRPEPVKQEVQEETIKVIKLPDMLTIQELADKMKIKGSDIVKKLFMAGKMVSLNSDISFEEAENIALDYEIICEHEEKIDMVAELLKEADEEEDKMVKRPPVVCVMGHVDHGKTSLLDAIRSTSVTSREAGGITQHIGAYMVEAKGEKITFLDTPGHEAFTAMRMRGANSTDIAVLVVAADDGVMPQTIEAINHAKAAGVEIIVAVNKIDKPGANIERVKQELTEYELIAEDWGGSTVFVPVSAKTHENIDKLLEMILLTADVMELKANPNRKARGLVVEAQLDKGRGPVATVLVQKGTLRVGDNIVIGSSMGKVRALINDKGEKVKAATPSMPVAVLGLNSVPDAGEIVVSTASEKEAKEIAEAYITQNKEKLIAETKSKLSLDDLYSEIKAGNIKELNIIVKADVQGSVEAIKQSLVKLSNDEVAVRIIHGGVGAINESDATLASASNAIIIGFNVKPDNTAKDICEREKVDLRLYSVIYTAIDDVEAALKGMLEPIYEEQIIGHAEVRQTFKASGVGIIAGSFVLDGKIVRGSKARITRGGSQIFDGPLASLKRFKDDVKEVNAGYECGLVFEKFNDLAEGDQIEFYQMVEVPRK
jgi:translation initiation factor IF-2